ncbi:MAG: hypothetical protein PHN88_09305 [Ignavibacteria bacterium]|nr:hypothetical protein [Ignavibacteria bacterium]
MSKVKKRKYKVTFNNYKQETYFLNGLVLSTANEVVGNIRDIGNLRKPEDEIKIVLKKVNKGVFNIEELR